MLCNVIVAVKEFVCLNLPSLCGGNGFVEKLGLPTLGCCISVECAPVSATILLIAPGLSKNGARTGAYCLKTADFSCMP